MPAPASSNDSIITFGLELLEATEQAVGEIVSEIGKDDVAHAPASPEIETYDAERAARHEELARLADLELAQTKELEYEGLER